jgi:hypothetical protein
MTSRMNLAYVAIAALALITSDVSAARALSFCDIYPQRCRYSPSGRGYYYPQGQRMPEGLEPAFIERNGTSNAASTQARGSWGCAATNGTAKSGSFGYPNRASAAYGALSQCAKHGGNCRIIACSSSVHNAYEGRAIFYAHR